MRRSFAIALLHLRTTFRSKGALLTMFGLPLVLTLIFGVLVGGGGQSTAGYVYPVAVVDLDDSFASRTLTGLLEQEPTIRLRLTAPADLEKLLSDQEVEVGVVIPAEFGAGVAAGLAPEVRLVSRPGGNLYLGVAPTVRGLVSRLGQDLRLALHSLPEADRLDAARVAEAYERVAAVRSEVGTTVATHAVTRHAVAKGLTPANYAATGFTVTFVMMQCFMMSGAILAERRQGTWGRLLTTPTARAVILGGYLLSFFLTGMAQFAILVVATRLLFQVSWGPLLPLFALGAGTVLSAAGMGLFLAGIVRTYEQQTAIGIVFINATAMLGGAYWDLNAVSDTMRRIGHLTPQAWAIEGFREVMLRGGSWPAIALPLAVLLGIAAVFMTAGLLRIRYE